MDSSVVLINLFEVTMGQEERFVEWWRRCSEALEQEPGFLDATLHQHMQPGALFQFINISHWETPQALERARTLNKAILQPTSAGKGNPGLYKTVLQYKKIP